MSWMEEVDTTNPQLLKEVQEQTQKLLQLEYEMMVAEDAYNQAKQRYTEYATKELPEKYLSAGISSLTTPEGRTIRIVTHTRASIKKGKDDGRSAKQSIAAWLRQHGGDNLIKSECIVDPEAKHLLVEVGVPFEEVTDINTNSLKAFIIDGLGQNGAVATLNVSDLPEGLSFYQWNQAETA